MFWRPLTLLLCLAALQLVVSAQSNSTTLSFQVQSGGNDNYFIRDDTSAAQVLVTSSNNTSPVRRLVVALPAGNSGVLAYFLPLNGSGATNSTLNVALQNGSLATTTELFNNTGVQADLSFSGNATLGVTILGAVRAMRDYVEGAGLTHEIFNYTLASSNSTSLHLHRQWINATSTGEYRSADFYLTAKSGASFSVTPGNNGTFTPPTVNILVNGSSAGIVQMRLVCNETSLRGLSPSELFLPEGKGSTKGINTALQGLANGSDFVSQEVSFLTYQDKFTAGGWRFLTYFGRDSMIALRLLMPTLSSNAIESALGAVIERVNSTGALCHEETIGDYASFVNIGNNQSDLGNKPFYDYKMIDTDLFLLPALRHYFLELPQGKGRAKAFLAKNATLQNGTYAELLNRTVTYNLERATLFAQNSSVANLLHFRDGQPVGNWRDSNEGTGYGPIPFDVNTALVPASLRATAALARANIIGGNASAGLAVEADGVAAVWEENALPFFEVSLTNETAEARLTNFVAKANLSEALIGGSGNATAGGNKAFYALSLDDDGTPVQVLHSDIGFNLLYGNNVSQSFLQHFTEALTPYPRGLLTNIGMVVANPAYDVNTTNIDVLNRAAYHGTVVWSWQQGLMAGGLTRQLGFCNVTNSSAVVDINPPAERGAKPAWCNNSTFVKSVEEAQSRLWTSIMGGTGQIFSEVWSYDFDNSTNTFSVADLGTLSPSGTESDAIQLWSYGFLGLLSPEAVRVGH
ncbi:hypothetical protein BD410DRAFT_793667 [Rickenella mellea]|uniref:Glycogen debranching enzyme n=1 Tax=Rickenella mellea TaxID=50990 RepID=A0A4Y7PSE8_9AGAM|nr:hypothetical protein BD410DRAFT_793667 [Rickenella mellea]